MDPRFGSPGRIARGKLPFRGARLLIHKGRPPAAPHGAPAPRPPEAILGHSVRQAATSAIQINPAPTWIRPVLVVSIPLRRSPREAALRRGNGDDAEAFDRELVQPWLSAMGCAPPLAMSPRSPPAGVHLRRVPRRGPCMHMHGRLESSGSPWFDAVTDGLAPPRGVRRRAWLTASHRGEAIDAPSWGSMVAPGHDAVE